MRLLFVLFFLAIVYAETPVIKIIAPLEDVPIIAYKELSILGEVKNTSRLSVNNYKVEIKNDLFKLKFKFSEPGYREFVLKAENEKGKTEKKLKVLSLDTFPDIVGDDFQREIELVTTLELLGSYLGTDFFRPGYFLRKAELARVILLLSDIKPTSAYGNTYKFNDLLPSHWAHSYIQLALNNNLISPNNNDEFGPNQIITRLELLRVLRRYYRNSRDENRTFFKDLSEDKKDYKFVNYLASKGYLPLLWIQEENFFPNKPVTRAELAFILSRIDKIYSKIKDTYLIEMPIYKKNIQKEGVNELNISFKVISDNVFMVECVPDKTKITLFIEILINNDELDKKIILIDDGLGVDLITGDNVFTGIMNLSGINLTKYTFQYKLFDEFNLIYKVGEGRLRVENDQIKVY